MIARGTVAAGPGAPKRLVAGMAIGTAFTVFFVPAIYLLIAKDRHAERRAEAPFEAPAPGPHEAMAAGGARRGRDEPEPQGT